MAEFDAYTPLPGTAAAGLRRRRRTGVSLSALRRRTAACSAFGLTAALLAGCASDAQSGGSGQTITVMAVATFQSSVFTDPQFAQGADVAADYINAHGGLNGHKIVVATCNDALDPNTAAQCAEQAVTEHVAAMVVPTTVYGGEMYAITNAAGIPYIGTDGIVPQDGTSGYSWPIYGGAGVSFAGEGLLAGRLGCTGIGFIADNGASFQQAAADVAAGAKQAGIKFASDFVTPPTLDYSTPIAKVTAGGIDCIGADTSQSDISKIQSAVAQSGQPIKIVLASAFALPSALRAMGSKADGIAVASVSQPVPATSSATSTNAQIAEFLRQMHTYASSVAPDGGQIEGWGAMQLLVTAAKGLGPVTAAGIQANLKKLTAYDPGFAPAIDFTRPALVASQPRLFSTQVYDLVWNNGAYGQAGAAFDTATALNAVAR